MIIIRLCGRQGVLFVFLLFVATTSSFSQSMVSGTITGKGTSLPGASVIVVGGATTVADSAGRFVVQANSGQSLRFSYVGFDTREILLGNETQLTVALAESPVMLEDVVVVGYGTSLRKDVTGAITSIKEDDFVPGNITNPLQQIQGKVPGLVIVQPGGDPNGDLVVRIRGATSLEGQPPLLVIDGVAIDDFYRASTTLNPADIESFDVLKDASAAAIYGSRGANGVIIVTTKKGKPGQVTVEYNGQAGVDVLANHLNVLSACQWRELTAHDAEADGLDMGGHTDWQKAISRDAAFTQSHTVSVSSGTRELAIRGSVGYMDQDGIIRNSGKQVITARITAEQTAINNRLKISYGINTSTINRDLLPDQSSTSQARQIDGNGGAFVFKYTAGLLPVWPIYNDDGSYINFLPNDLPNPVLMVNELSSKQRQNFYQGSVKGDFEIIEGLKAGALASLARGDDIHDRSWPFATLFGGKSQVSKSNNNKLNYTGDVHLNFRKSIGRHTVDLTGVYEYNSFINDGFAVNAQGFIPRELLNNNFISTVSNAGDITSYKSEVRLISFLGRMVYNYADQLLFTFNFRRDGSSKFGSNNRWANFPSMALAWNATKSTLLSDSKWLHNLKLRVSYGLTGNQENLPPNAWQPLYSSASGPYLHDGSFYPSFGIVQEYDPNLKWEVRKSFNVGADFSLWRNVFGTIDFFSDRTSDLLFTYNIPQPPFLTPTAYTNAASASNQGVELAIGATLIKSRALTWTIQGNIASVSNRITKLDGTFRDFKINVNQAYGYASGGKLGETAVTRLKEGYAAGVFWIPEHAGFDAQGHELFYQRNSDGAVTGMDSVYTNQDRIYIDPTPDFSWGLTNRLTLGRFDLSIFIRGVSGQKTFANQLMTLGSQHYLPGYNVSTDELNNGFTKLPDASTYWLRSGSFARLENVTLGYNFKRMNWTKQLRIYLAARNLFVLTSYRGSDPEVNTDGNQRYIDYSYYPKTRGLTLGLDVRF